MSGGPSLLSRIERSPVVRLAVASAGLGVLWCVVLPAACNWAPVRQHIDALESKRIDASAMFYTELETLEPTIRRLEKR